MKKVTLIPENFSFKGNTPVLLKYKSEVESFVNAVGSIKGQTSGTYILSFGKKRIAVPKSWVLIIE